jgi:hypothetical protein
VSFCIHRGEHLFDASADPDVGEGWQLDPDRLFVPEFPSFLLVAGRAAGRTGTAGGAGYLVQHDGRGIVIDPGPGFVSGFREEGLRPAEVSAVVVTGPEARKTGDLEDLLELVARLRRRSPESPRVDLLLTYPAFVKYGSWIASAFQEAVGVVNILHPGLRHVVGTSSGEIVLLPVAGSSGPEAQMQQVAGLRIFLDDRLALVMMDGPSATAWTRREKRPAVLILRTLPPSVGDLRRIGDRAPETGLGLVEAVDIVEELSPGLVVLAGQVAGPAGMRLEVAASMTDCTGVHALPQDAGLVLGLASGAVFCQLRRTFIPASKTGLYEQDPGEPLMYYDRALESRIGAQGLAWAYERVLGQGGGLAEAAHRFARRRDTER